MRKTVLLLTVTVMAAVFPLYHAYGADGDLEAATDRYMETVLDEYHVAGAAVCVVKDGAVLLEKGYGYADVDAQTPVGPTETGFQIASTSKLYTAVAAMQMVEQGKLNLDTDVNTYLTVFQIENPYKTPVTLRQLLTHTGGFDDRTPLYVPSRGDVFFADMEPLGDMLSREMPPVIREPGTFCEYSVYGMALAGYLVEVASGMSFGRYVTENILKPLGMDHSSYGLTESIIGTMSKPYAYRGGRYTEKTYTVIGDHPSGSICASASDMGNFMRMLLHGGEYGGTRVLGEETVAAMLSKQYARDRKLPGFGLGFMEAIRNGHMTYEHGGALPSFRSKVSILPEEGLGVFIVINTDSAKSGGVCNEYVDLVYGVLTDRAADAEAKVLAVGTPFDMDAGRVSGRYTFGPYGRRDPTKLKSAMMTCRLECDDTGDLTFYAEGEVWPYRYAGDGLFYNADHGYLKVGDMGGRMVLSTLGMDYEKVSPVDGGLLAAAAAGIPVYLVLCVCLTVSLIRKKTRKQLTALKAALLMSGIAALMYFGLSGAIGMLYMRGDTRYIYSLIMPLIHLSCYLLLAGTTVSAIYVVQAWAARKGGTMARVMYTIALLLGFVNITLMCVMNGFGV